MDRDTKTAGAVLLGALALTPIALLAAAVSTGAGHGDYLWAKVFFPYTMISAEYVGWISGPFIVLAIAQIPLYGAWLAWVAKRQPARLKRAAFCLAVVHAVAVALCLVLPLQSFS